MSIINIGVIREGKTPPDFRVPLSPEQCVALEKQYPDVKVTVQTSLIRCFSNQSYTDLGLTVQEDLRHCDILLGVKEVPKDQLLAGKTYLFFSHTFKKQPYNRALLQEFDNHKKIARITFPLWLYVAISGVIVYVHGGLHCCVCSVCCRGVVVNGVL